MIQNTNTRKRELSRQYDGGNESYKKISEKRLKKNLNLKKRNLWRIRYSNDKEAEMSPLKRQESKTPE